MNCSLCDSESERFFIAKNRTYFQCHLCKAIFLDPYFLPSLEEEKERYKLHNNDENDAGYRNFVSPIIEEILKTQTSDHKGLDFGSGPTPIISSLLRNEGYLIESYDPFFAPNHQILSRSYNFIVCCEVMEHFHYPLKEFELLFDLLHKSGCLYCKTFLYKTSIDFGNWWYKNDLTHVFFYTESTLKWIQEKFKFDRLVIKEDVIIFTK